MMRWIVGSSLKLRLLVVALAAALMVFGVRQLQNASVDALPEFAPVTVEVQTEALGLSAVEVEELITVPLEQNLLNGVAFLDEIQSESLVGLSRIVMRFESGTDPLRARQVVQERLTQWRDLPRVSRPPVMIQPLSATSRVMIVRLSSSELSPMDMSVLARWTIKPRLMGVPGVANVSIWGQRERQLQVLVDPARLRERGVSLDQVIETTGNALWVSPLSFLEASVPGSGGFIDTPNQRLGIQHVLAINTPEELAQVPVEGCTGSFPSATRHVDANCPAPPQARPRVLLGEVATVVEDHQPLIGDDVSTGDPGLMLVIEKFPETNTLAVTEELESALTDLQPGLPGLQMDTTIYRPATFIESALDNLATLLLLGGLLLLVLLGAFLFDWRVALISAVAIPLSLVAAGLVLYLRGTTFNAIILAGMVVAIGTIVDDAIVDIDHIVRRLRQHRQEGSGRSTAAVILEASLEVRSAIVYATLIMFLLALPIFFYVDFEILGNMNSAFFWELTLSYALALLASMVVALTVTPVLAGLLLSNGSIERRESPIVRSLGRHYEGLLARIAFRPTWAYALVGIGLVAALAILPFVDRAAGQSLLPAFKERDLLIHWRGAPGTSLPEMDRITTGVSAELRALPGVRNVGAHVGRAITSDQATGINAGEVWVSIDGGADYDDTLASIEEVVNGYPGLEREVLTYSQDQLRSVQAGDDIVVRVYGQDLATLRSKAEEVHGVLVGIDGLERERVELQAQEPQLEIEVDPVAAQQHNLKPGDVRRAAATLVTGVEVGNLFEEQKVFEVMVVGVPETRQSLTSVQNVLIDKPNGEQIRLGDVAQVRIAPVPTVIKHDAVSRYIDVLANVKGRGYSAVAHDVEDGLAAIQFSLQYHAEVLGEYEDLGRADERLLGLAVTSAIGIFLLLQAVFSSWRLAGLTFLTFPTALVGGVVAAFAVGEDLSLGSLIGFLAVLAITVRNGIVQISHYQRLEEEGREPFGVGLVLRGARERLAPTLMTALATALALLPLIVSGSIPGQEVLQPMAVVILGGLVTATVLNLFVLPSLYLHFAPGPHAATTREPSASDLTFNPATSD